MYIPLPLRLTFFYTLLLGLALFFFGRTVYIQAEQRAYRDLDNTLNSRAASVQLGKDLFNGSPHTSPITLPSVDGLGTGGVAIEVLDSNLNLLATTAGSPTDGGQTTVGGLSPNPVPWDAKAAQWVLQHPFAEDGTANSIYSTITYQGQPVRVYTLLNQAFGSDGHIIQTARSERDIEQSLSDLQQLLLRGGALVLTFAFAGGFILTWGVLARVRHMTKTAQSISASRDFSKRVPYKPLVGRDELATLAMTFNEMLANLEESYQRQQRFVADASHELRAPITSIRCNLDLLAEAPDLPAEEVQAALIDARAEADRMGRLVSDLLTLAHADASQRSETIRANGYKKGDGQTAQVDLDSLLLEVFRQYRPSESADEEKKQQGPRLLLQHITPVKVDGDADQLKQVLVALLDNALKYTPYEGTVSLSLTTRALHHPPDAGPTRVPSQPLSTPAPTTHEAIVKVSDTGIGILPEDLPHIFERFYRADRARSRDRGGSGLGLAIVQSIVQEHHGSVEVESTPGKGSTFTLRLPVVGE